MLVIFAAAENIERLAVGFPVVNLDWVLGFYRPIVNPSYGSNRL
ncbi:hypothetical protein [Merismopedia glauca]|nr:hypothetical protein [Merismopedia glauca]